MKFTIKHNVGGVIFDKEIDAKDVKSFEISNIVDLKTNGDFKKFVKRFYLTLTDGGHYRINKSEYDALLAFFKIATAGWKDGLIHKKDQLIEYKRIRGIRSERKAINHNYEVKISV